MQRLLLAGRSSGGDAVAAAVAGARDCLVEAIRLGASRQDEVPELPSEAHVPLQRVVGRQVARPSDDPGRFDRFVARNTSI